MWILKGVLLGLLLTVLETLGYIYFRVYNNLPPSAPGTSTAVDARVYPMLTIQNPWWWVVLIGTLVVAFWIVKPHR